jgi:hypothetical protein
VLYLGRPTDSVTVEAYRHLIDPIVADGGPVPPIRPRVLITCEVSVTEILDLRSAANRTLADITLAPAATRMGETLALFTDLLTDAERPLPTGEEMWVELPPDPRKPPQDRHLQVVR